MMTAPYNTNATARGDGVSKDRDTARLIDRMWSKVENVRPATYMV